MRNLEIKNIKGHPSQSLAKANASRDLQINFNQAEDALTIPAESRHDYKCGSATQSGRSMIEMLGVLAIIGVLSVGGIAGYSKAMMKYRINKTIEQITLIAENVRSFFAPQGNYVGVLCFGSSCNYAGCQGHNGFSNNGSPTYANNGCPIIKKAKILPDEMLTVNDAGKITAITNPFGYTANLMLDNKSTDNDYKAFHITYLIRDNIEACIELMSQDWSAVNVKAIRLYSSTGGMYFKTPVSIDLATEKCATSISNTTEAGKAKDYPELSLFVDIDLSSPYWNPKAEKAYTWQN